MQNPYPTIINDLRTKFNSLPKYMTGDYDRFMEEWKMSIDFTHGYDLAKPGELFWGISEIELKPYNAVIQPQVRDINGQLITAYGVVLFIHWSGTPALDPAHQPRYFNNGLAGWTKNEGSVGWGYAGDSYTNPTDPSSNPGPFHVWASAHPPNFEPKELRVVGSDCLHNIGWWDEHNTPNPVFQIMQKLPETGPGPGPSPTGEYVMKVYDPDNVLIGYFPIVSGSHDNKARVVLSKDNLDLGHIKIITP